jgi:hypothetical protein
MDFRHAMGPWKWFQGHRWIRRITHGLVLIAALLGAQGNVFAQSFVDRWVIDKLSAFLKEETGLSLQATELEFHLVQGRVVLRHVAIGGDLLKADRMEVQMELSTLLGRNLHFVKIEVENPESYVDLQRLSRIHLKPHPDKGSTPMIRLDRLAITGGKLHVQEPAWKLPHAEFTYTVNGEGLGPNRIFADVRVPQFTLGTGAKAVDGSLLAQLNLSDLSLELKDGQIRVGKSDLAAHGNLAFKEQLLAADISGKLDLAEALSLMDPSAPATWRGLAEFRTELRGAVANPAWNISLHGRGMSGPSRQLQPGEADLAADGNLEHINIRNLVWNSSQGRLQASGQWKRGTGSQVRFQCERFGLELIAALTRARLLESLSADLTGEAEIPGNPWVPPQLDNMKISAAGHLLRTGDTVGQVTFHLADGLLVLENVALNIPELELEGSATMRFGKKSLQSVAAKAIAKTDASIVADVLQAWEIGEGHSKDGKSIELGMSGYAIGRAEFNWDSQGIRFKGHGDVEDPRWHGASMDHLSADVSILNDELRIENIEGVKGAGRATGSLWLTWGDVAPGQDQIDMTYEASRLPIEEGLRAGDVGDLPITGIGSGKIRIHGPYSRIRIEAMGLAENAEVYGFKIPHGSGEMDYDISGDHLVVKDIRVAETAEQLGSPDEEPTGLLAIHGGIDMDLKDETWHVWGKGSVDSGPLGLKGPRFLAQVDTRFDGPWVSPFGRLQLPSGTFDFRGGRLFMDQQSLEGIEGHLEMGGHALHLKVNSEGKSVPILTVDGGPRGEGLAGSLSVHIAPDSVDTAHLAARLTKDMLKDGGLDLKVDGTWDSHGLHWQGQIDELVGHFDGFDLAQQHATRLEGDAFGANLDLSLQGQASVRQGTPTPGSAALMRAKGRIPFSATVPMGLQLTGEAELANLKSILDHVLEVDEYSLLGDLKPEGSASFDLTLGGPVLRPSLDGVLSLQGGSLQIRTYPQSVENLSFTLHFKGRDVTLLETDPLTGRVAQGALKAWGLATWEPGGLSSYDLQTRLDGFQLRDVPEGFELYGSLNAVLQGTKEEGGILSGTIQARHMAYQADINLRDLILASAMGISPLMFTADPNDPLQHIDLDLDLVLSQPWEFDTNLLKVQGRPVGAFKIAGTLAEPSLKGKMDILPGGRITNLLPAGDVVLERGIIEWTNPQSRYPNLDLQGRVDVPPYVVNLGIHGSLDSLEMKQSSTPSLRQNEITAILIDPSLAPNIGSSAELSSSTATSYGLASTGSGLVTTLALANFQETLRRTFNLDRVSVAWRTGSGTSGSETNVTVGKSVDLFGHRTPVVLSHQKIGDTSTTSGQVEWRFGNTVLLLGVSQSGTNGAAPSGEIRHIWSLGW